MNQQTSKRQRSREDQPERGPRAYRRWQGYVQGMQMGAFLFLLGHFPYVLLLNLIPFADAWIVISLYFLFSGVLVCLG